MGPSLVRCVRIVPRICPPVNTPQLFSRRRYGDDIAGVTKGSGLVAVPATAKRDERHKSHGNNGRAATWGRPYGASLSSPIGNSSLTGGYFVPARPFSATGFSGMA